MTLTTLPYPMKLAGHEVSHLQQSPTRQLKRRISEKTTITPEVPPREFSSEVSRRELKRRISEKTPKELVETDSKVVQIDGLACIEGKPVAQSMADCLVQQILASGSQLGRQKRLLAWLRD